MSGKKCKHCGSSEIEVDAARGDAVCMSCGTVLEDNIIVAEVEFRENTHGGASAIGQFVSAESKGGATGFGRAFNAGIGQESKEITLRKARESITALCQQLRLNQQCIDIACNFYKMALSRHLTIGRPASHTQAACVYMTCRTEGTAHLLIDVSDAVPMYCYQLGRSYSKLSRALCINIPPTDPCLYVLRFASQLHFDDKQHQVASTALRLVQRMKRDSIHSGRRPSGICGAALLIAARLHEFSRTPSDIVRIVKIHESTLRKRLFEFGDTPSSNLTLDEFMTVDLEEEQDPPAFRAARKRDKERLQRLMEEEDGEKELTDLQKEIDAQLEKDTSKRKKLITSALMGTPGSVQMFSDVSSSEDMDATRFAAEDTLTLIGELANDVQIKDSKDSKSMDEELQNNEKLKLEKGLGPELAAIGLGQPEEKSVDKFVKPEPKHAFSKDLTSAEELVLSERDEDYVDSIIMNEDEANYKTHMWHKVNAGYLKEQKIKEEIRAKEKEENKDKKKKIRGNYKKKVNVSAATAGEAIEKMLASKKMSAKINYDILKTLDNSGGAVPSPKETTAVVESKPATPATPITPVTPATPMTPASPAVVSVPASPVPRKRRKKAPRTPAPRTPARPATPMTPPPAESLDDDYEVEPDPEPEPSGELSLAAMLQNGDDDDYYAYDYEEY